MTTEIICPKCQTGMIEGFVLDRMDNKVKKRQIWVEGAPEASFWSGLKTSGREAFTVQSFRCPSCRFLEFYTTEKVEI